MYSWIHTVCKKIYIDFRYNGSSCLSPALTLNLFRLHLLWIPVYLSRNAWELSEKCIIPLLFQDLTSAMRRSPRCLTSVGCSGSRGSPMTRSTFSYRSSQWRVRKIKDMMWLIIFSARINSNFTVGIIIRAHMYIVRLIIHPVMKLYRTQYVTYFFF